MKKLLLLAFISYLSLIPQLQSISIAEYIKRYGMPQIVNGKLNLSHGGITDLHGLQDIPNKDQVETLNLDTNRLQELPIGIFNGFDNLKSLSLGNKLQTLPVTIFNGLNNLEELYLAYNELQTLPAAVFDSLLKLKLLDLSNNQLQELPNTIFSRLKYLMSLSLSNNQLQELPDTIFSELKYLMSLSLANNQLRKLPNTIFNGLDRLSSLNIYGNPFNADFIPLLKQMIENIPNLKSLNGKPKDYELESYRIYHPKTLQEITKEHAMQHLTPEQIEELALAKDPVFELLPLTPQQRAEIIAKNIDVYRQRLHELNPKILDLLLHLPLTAQQKASITAEKRRRGL